MPARHANSLRYFYFCFSSGPAQIIGQLSALRGERQRLCRRIWVLSRLVAKRGRSGAGEPGDWARLVPPAAEARRTNMSAKPLMQTPYE